MCTRTGGIDGALIGANESAEGGDEGTDESTVSGVDIIINHSLEQTSFDKKSFLQYLKEYVKRYVSLRYLYRWLTDLVLSFQVYFSGVV